MSRRKRITPNPPSFFVRSAEGMQKLEGEWATEALRAIVEEAGHDIYIPRETESKHRTYGVLIDTGEV